MYLAVIMDWHSRCVLSWRLSNTLEADFCVDALEGALSMGVPGIFNTDQGSQFTSEAFTSVLLNRGVQISRDSAGAYVGNVFVERLCSTARVPLSTMPRPGPCIVRSHVSIVAKLTILY